MSLSDADLAAKLEPVVDSCGLYVENVRRIRAGAHSRLDVVVDLPDGPGGVSDAQLAEVTRAVSNFLDDLDPIKGAYTLEVSTPGIDRPLTSPRHFRRALGRRIEAVTVKGTKLRGTLTRVHDADIEIDTNEGSRRLAFDEIASASMVIEL